MTQHTVEHQCGTCRYEANGFHSFSKCSPLCTQAYYIRAAGRETKPTMAPRKADNRPCRYLHM